MILAILDVETCIGANLPLTRAIVRAEELGVDAVLVRTRTDDRRVTQTVAAVPRSGTGLRLLNGPPALYDPAVYDGVHLRADAPPRPARPRVLGASVHRGEPVRGRAVDYLLFAPVFAPRSKPGVAAAGLEALQTVVHSADVAVVALGGIEPANLERVAATGCAGVAALTPFCTVDDLSARALVARVRDVRWTAGATNDRLRSLFATP